MGLPPDEVGIGAKVVVNSRRPRVDYEIGSGKADDRCRQLMINQGREVWRVWCLSRVVAVWGGPGILRATFAGEVPDQRTLAASAVRSALSGQRRPAVGWSGSGTPPLNGLVLVGCLATETGRVWWRVRRCLRRRACRQRGCFEVGVGKMPPG